MNCKKTTIVPKTIKSNYKIPKAELIFSNYAWEKLVYMKEHATTEVSGFGITDPDNPLYVTDFHLVLQDCTSVSAKLNDKALADFQEDMLDSGLSPINFMRVQIHTHPGMNADPSGIDEETFYRVFGKCDWAIMFILGEDNKYTCTLQYNTFPTGRFKLPVVVEDFVNDQWDTELAENVFEEVIPYIGMNVSKTYNKYFTDFPYMNNDNPADFPCMDNNNPADWVCVDCGYCNSYYNNEMTYSDCNDDLIDLEEKYDYTKKIQ